MAQFKFNSIYVSLAHMGVIFNVTVIVIINVYQGLGKFQSRVTKDRGSCCPNPVSW